MGVSILLLTLNEEVNLPASLESIKWSDDIVVFDSHSTDRTVEIANMAGTKVVERIFDNYAAQRNAALNEVEYKHPWVLMVDADERVTPELRNEIEAVLSKEKSEITLYRIRRKDMFMGKWLRRSSGYPTWFGRLFKVGHVWIEREINEEYHTSGKIGYLQSHFIHYPFNKGVAYWFERHNRYSSMEASSLIQELRVPLELRKIFSSDPIIRRRILKQLAYRMPGRPFLAFCYLYLFRLGILDGRAGLTYCILRSIYEYMIDIKVKELQRREKGLPV
ncbi:MAG: glycosyltransferase family 2 protein [Proteobacteria bacterium]|nr:glycosyltransferase family 2 protein [Pseudomonadota bacterium]